MHRYLLPHYPPQHRLSMTRLTLARFGDQLCGNARGAAFERCGSWWAWLQRGYTVPVISSTEGVGEDVDVRGWPVFICEEKQTG